MNIIQRIQNSLYEYEIMTMQQLAILHSYKKKSIQPMITKMFNNHLIQKMSVPEIGKNAKAYYLTAQAAREAADRRNEAHLFREKEWGTAPGSVLHTLIANQFFCELIRASKENPLMGVTQWVGKKTLMARLTSEEEKKYPKMSGYGVLYHNQQKVLIYLNVLTGNESMSVMQEMVASHTKLIKVERNQDASNTCLLFICLGEAIAKNILMIWNQILGEEKRAPFVAAVDFEKLATEGVLSSAWKNQKLESTSILQMPFKEVKDSISDGEFLGKRQIIRLQFKTIAGFQEIKNESESVKGKEETQEPGIDWTVP
jgi:hypothetical protein